MFLRAYFNKNPTLTGVIFGLLAALIWGSWPVLTKLGVQQTLNHYDIAALRFTVAGLILLPLFLRRKIRHIGWRKPIIMSIGAGVPYVLVTVGGLSFAPAGHAGLITPSCMLAFTTLTSWWILGDKPTKSRLIGLFIIFVGILLIGGQGLLDNSGETWIGDVMFVIGGFFWASYTVAAKSSSVDSLHATAIVSVISMLFYMPFYLVFVDSGIPDAAISEVIFQAVFQGIFAAIMALLFYTQSVIILGAARGAIFATLVPGVALLLAFPILEEVPSSIEIMGVVTVSIGMIFALGFSGKFLNRRD